MTLLLTNSLYFLVIIFHLVAVPDFCVAFECKHENTDLSALNGTWQSWTDDSVNENISYQISLCSPLKPNGAGGNSCATGTSVCMKYNDTAYYSAGNFNASAPELTGGSNNDLGESWIILAGDPCPVDSVYNLTTSINFKCGPTLGSPVFLDFTSCVSYFEWETNLYCKTRNTEKEVKCYLYDDSGNRYDLSPLAKTKGGYLVSSELDTDVYINVCRDIEADPLTTGCPSTHAACRKSNGVFMGLGEVTEDLKRGTDGRLVLKYVSPNSEAMAGCTTKPSTTIIFICPERGVSKDPLIIEDFNCQYVIEWETEYACVEAKLHNKSCVLTKEDADIEIDLRPLKRPRGNAYKVSWPDSSSSKGTIYEAFLNICDDVGIPCPDAEHEDRIPSCQLIKGNDDFGRALGSTDHTTLSYADGKLTLTYKGGEKCHHNNFQRQTVINFVCNQTAGDGSPVFENEDDCIYMFTWPTKYACLDHPNEGSCGVDVGDKKYDLGPLSRRAGTNWMALHEQNDLFGRGQYFINVCHNIIQTGEASRCDPGAAICYREGLSTKNLGRYETKPVIDSRTNRTVISYTNGDICPGYTTKISSNITFICKPGDGDSAPVLIQVSDDQCFYEFEWRTAQACALGHYTGTDCKINADGLSFDLTPLTSTSASYKVSSTTDTDHFYYLNVCGPVTDQCKDSDIKDVGICQVPKDGNGDSYVTGQWASVLRYYDGMINLTYSGGTPYNDDNHTQRKSEIAFICDQDAGKGQPRFLAELASEHYYGFEWRTSYACPIEAMQCTAADEKLNQQYDLSSLTLTDGNNWAIDDSSNRKYYINICQLLNKVPVGSGCDPLAAVCRTKFENGQEKIDVANMGSVESRLVVEAEDKLRLVYKGGSCNNGTANVPYVTNIEFLCRHNTLTSPPSAPLQDGPCEYTIVWDTPAACHLQKDDDMEPCTAKDPNSDYVFNLSPLTSEDHPWNVTVDGSNYLINICGNISETICQGNGSKQYGACVQKNGITQGLAEAKTLLDFTEFGAMSILYEGTRLGNGLRIDVKIVFMCEPGKDIGYPSFQGKQGNTYVFNFFTALACTPVSTDCFVQDEAGKQYNLRPLTVEGYYSATDDRDTNTKYYINVCAPVQNVPDGKCIDGPIGGCQVASNGKSFNMGYIQSKPIAHTDGTLTLHYRNGDICHKGTENEAHRSTRINFYCSDTEHEPVFGYETQTCEYVFDWRTPSACAVGSSSGGQCKVVDPLYKHQFDLNALGSRDYSVTVDDAKYDISVCGHLQDTSKCGANSGAGVCLSKPSVKNFKPIIAGKANDKLIFDGGDLLLNYTSGDNNCYTVIKFSCDQKEDGSKGPQFVEKSEQNCHYLFDWPTQHACPPRKSATCSIKDTDGKSYDLSDLELWNDNYEVTDTMEKKRYIINVCRSIIYKKNATCPYTSAACMVDLTKPESSKDKYKNIGEPNGYQMKFENGQIVITYTNGDKCSNGKDNMTTHIVFKCDKNARHSSPAGHFMVGDCDHHFLWTSASACPLTDTSDGGGSSDITCKVTNPATGSVFDLSVLKSTSKGSMYSVKDKNNNLYEFNICDTVYNSKCTDAEKNLIGVCQSPPEGSDRPTYNAGKAVHNPWFDDGIVVLNFTGGDRCHNNQYERNTIISFVCNRHKGIGRPVFVDETEDCTYYISWHTNIVCEQELKCSVDTNDYRTIDLSPLADNPDQVVHSTEDGSIFYLSVCSSLTPTTGLLCPAGSGLCQVKSTDKVSHTSLGKPKSSPTYDKTTKDISLMYVNGSKCDTDPSKNFSSRVIFSCLPGPVRSSPRFVSEADCEYVFQWDTYTVCTEQNETVCGYHDNTGDFYDFKLLQQDKPVEVKVKGETKYLINMCAGIKSDDTSSCDSHMVCRKKDGLSFGEPNNYKVAKEGQYLKMTFDSGAKCAGERNAESSIQFVCNREAGQGTPIVLASMNCSVVFEWETSFVCPTQQNPCSIVIDEHLYDLSILSKIQGAWNVTDKDKNTYWINVCTSVIGSKLPDVCDEKAAACRMSKDKTGGEVLGLVSAQKKIYKNSDTGALVLEYAEGSACSDRSDPATTKINFICGTTFGAPSFVESDANKKLCIYEFNWKTKFACKVESESLKVTKGILQDQAGLIADLRPIWNKSFVVDQKLDSGNENKYEILMNGSSTHCNKGVICEIENNNIYRTLGTFASAKFTQDDWVIEATYTTPEKCSGDESSHNVTSTIQFICSQSEMNPKLLYSKKDCFFMFSWETKHACLSAKVLVPASGSATGNQAGTSSSSKGGVSASTVVGIVATFLGAIVLCILLVVFHRQERREACFQRVRGLFPRGRSEYSQLPTGTVDDIFGDEEEVVSVQDAAGGDNEEDPIISVTTAPASYHDDSDEDLLA